MPRKPLRPPVPSPQPPPEDAQQVPPEAPEPKLTHNRREHYEFVGELLAQSVLQKDIVRAVRQKWPDEQFSRGRVLRFIRKVLDEWVKKGSDPRAKDDRAARLFESIEADEAWLARQRAAAMRHVNAKGVPTPDLAAAMQFNKELRHVRNQKARLFGIEAAVEVNVTHTHTLHMGDAVAEVIGQLSADQAGEWLRAGRENERLAAQMRKQLAEGSIDTTGEEVAAE